jgi:ribosomal protein L32
MPKAPRDSTSRRHRLADIIDSYSATIPTKCSSCKKYNRVCRIYIRSGRYREYNYYGLRYNIRVTENKW